MGLPMPISPLTKTRPEVAGQSPLMYRSMEDLPQPLAPVISTFTPCESYLVLAENKHYKTQGLCAMLVNTS